MNTKIKQSLVGGIAATVVMTIVMMFITIVGMPKMCPPAMMATMMGMPIAVGWIMHFIIGISFAAAYSYLFQPQVNISSKLIIGMLFGIAIFSCAQIAMAIMGAIVDGVMPEPERTMLPIIIIGHVIFGIVVALMVKKPKISNK